MRANFGTGAVWYVAVAIGVCHCDKRSRPLIVPRLETHGSSEELLVPECVCVCSVRRWSVFQETT